MAQTLDTAMQQFTLKGARIRRLTPKECERLQGFPDDWTRWSKDGKEISDSQRYKMIGNAVSVPVVQVVIKKLIDFDKQEKENKCQN